jgi:hypothetical protein
MSSCHPETQGNNKLSIFNPKHIRDEFVPSRNSREINRLSIFNPKHIRDEFRAIQKRRENNRLSIFNPKHTGIPLYSTHGQGVKHKDRGW